METLSHQSPVGHRISVIIPVLNEAGRINPLIEHIQDQNSCENCEIIVVDGDPNGGTINVVRHKGVKLMVSARGRSRQMNAGAAVTALKQHHHYAGSIVCSR